MWLSPRLRSCPTAARTHVEPIQHQLFPMCPQLPFPPLLGCSRRKSLPDSAADGVCSNSMNNHRRCPQKPQYLTSTSHPSACSHLQEVNLTAQSPAYAFDNENVLQMPQGWLQSSPSSGFLLFSSPSSKENSAFCFLNGELTSLFLQLLYWHCRAKTHFKLLQVNKSHSTSRSSVVSSSTLSLTDKFPSTGEQPQILRRDPDCSATPALPPQTPVSPRPWAC